MKQQQLLVVLLCLWWGCSAQPTYPSFDGSQHNKDHPSWGQRGQPYIRLQVRQADYAASGGAAGIGDGLAGPNRPSARVITLALLNQPYFKAKSATNSSYLLTGLGQFISHDITRGVATAQSNGGLAPIPIPPGDPYFATFRNQTPVQQGSRAELPLTRSNYTRLTPGGPREQTNDCTAWLDGSQVYGQSEATARMLRAGTAGRLLTDGNRLLPLNADNNGAPRNPAMKNNEQRVPVSQLRLSGNPNVNQNPMLMTLVTIFVREHNRRARLVEAVNPGMSDDDIFMEARKWVIGHIQRISLDDYLAALGIRLPPYTGYNASLNPAVDAFFSTVAYRYGHATINDVVLRLDESWAMHPKGYLTLEQAYYNPNVALSAGLEPLIRGLLVQPQARVEPRWSLAVAGNFAGHSTVNGTDLAAINIQRGRDHGIPDYNTCRRAMGLPAAKTFADITPDLGIQAILQQLYGSVDNIDAYIGGLAEPAQGTSHVGPLFTKSIQEQFARTRDADWFYYENGANNKVYNDTEIDEIRKTSLRDIIARNTNITDLPENIWVAGAGMACAAGEGGTGSGQKQLLLPALMAGSAKLQVVPADTDGWVRVTVISPSTSGWLGFGVADPASTSPMIGADMVVGRLVNDKAVVLRYRAVEHAPPGELPAEAQDRLKVIRFEQSAAGGVLMEFERPMAAGSNGYDRGLPASAPARLIIARGRSNAFDANNGYHGASNREIIELPQGVFGRTASITIDETARSRRYAHGVLMALNFIVIMPLGALAARQLRCHWIKVPALRASLFYVHIATQLAGVAIATAGFVIATRWFNVPIKDVRYSHGKLGVATLALVYSQMLVGFARPSASAPTRRRHIWDLVHTTLGRASMLIGIANVALGVTIFCQFFDGDFSMWAAWCAAALGAISLVQYVFDRQEKYAVLRNEAMLMGKPLGGNNNSRDLGDIDTDLKDVDSKSPFDGDTGQPGGKPHKLTASLLHQHHAASRNGSGTSGVGLTHPQFAPAMFAGAGPGPAGGSAHGASDHGSPDVNPSPDQWGASQGRAGPDRAGSSGVALAAAADTPFRAAAATTTPQPGGSLPHNDGQQQQISLAAGGTAGSTNPLLGDFNRGSSLGDSGFVGLQPGQQQPQAFFSGGDGGGGRNGPAGAGNKAFAGFSGSGLSDANFGGPQPGNRGAYMQQQRPVSRGFEGGGAPQGAVAAGPRGVLPTV